MSRELSEESNAALAIARKKTDAEAAEAERERAREKKRERMVRVWKLLAAIETATGHFTRGPEPDNETCAFRLSAHHYEIREVEE